MNLDREASAAKSFFLGQVIEENLFPYPVVPEEEAETLRLITDSVDKFMKENLECIRQCDRDGAFPDEYIESLKELGLFGLVVPEEHGGIGVSSAGYARVVQSTTRYDASTAITIGAHNSIGIKALLIYGTEEQKASYLPRLACGDMIGAFCLTEPGAGSDVASMKCTAKKNEDGSWVLNGEKIWITNGPMADFFTVFANTDTKKGKITAFIVERSWDGVSVGPKEDKMGLRASATSSVHFNNTPLPPDAVIYEEGKGFKVAMSVLNTGRTGLGGGCVGAIKQLVEMAAAQAVERKQFGRSIAEFGLIQDKLARMTVDGFAAESVVNLVAHYIDSKHLDYSVEAAISKIFATEALWRTAYEALQVAGGNGFMKEFDYERYTRDARINTIFEGTNEILRLYVSLSGFKDAGAYLRDVAQGFSNIFNDPIKGFGTLSSYATKRLSQFTSLGRDRLESIHPALHKEAAIFESGVQELGRAVENVLRRHGKNIIGKQFASKRIADTAIDLFVGLATLSRVTSLIEERSEEDCQHEISIARVFAFEAEQRMRLNLRAMDKNVDDRVRSLAEHIVDQQRFPWDII